MPGTLPALLSATTANEWEERSPSVSGVAGCLLLAVPAAEELLSLGSRITSSAYRLAGFIGRPCQLSQALPFALLAYVLSVVGRRRRHMEGEETCRPFHAHRPAAVVSTLDSIDRERSFFATRSMPASAKPSQAKPRSFTDHSLPRSPHPPSNGHQHQHQQAPSVGPAAGAAGALAPPPPAPPSRPRRRRRHARASGGGEEPAARHHEAGPALGRRRPRRLLPAAPEAPPPAAAPRQGRRRFHVRPRPASRRRRRRLRQATAAQPRVRPRPALPRRACPP
jgi:hypothetical protein